MKEYQENGKGGGKEDQENGKWEGKKISGMKRVEKKDQENGNRV